MKAAGMKKAARFPRPPHIHTRIKLIGSSAAPRITLLIVSAFITARGWAAWTFAVSLWRVLEATTRLLLRTIRATHAVVTRSIHWVFDALRTAIFMEARFRAAILMKTWIWTM